MNVRFGSRVFRNLFAPRPVPQNFRKEFPISLSLRPKQLRAAAEESAFLVPAAAQFQFQYPTVQCPVRIFHGTGDQVSEYDQARRLDQALRRSSLYLLPDTGHMVTYADTAGLTHAVATLTGVAPP
jgi:pimeloyl-ACP methyl ester carboxylesterase